MPMINVQPVIMQGGIPPQAVEKRLRKSYAMVGLEGMGASAADAGAPNTTSWLESLISSWSGTGQQILLNQNAQEQMHTGPGGTTVYYPAGTGNPLAIGAAGASNVLPLVMIGGAVLLVVMMQRR